MMRAKKIKSILLKPTPTVLSAMGHFAVLVIMLVATGDPDMPEPVSLRAEIVNAVAIDKKVLEREIKGIRSAEIRKEKALKRQLDLATKKAKDAVEKRKVEERHLRQIKKQKKDMEVASRKAATKQAEAEKNASLAIKKADKERRLAAEAARDREKAEKNRNEIEAARDRAKIKAQVDADQNEINKLLVAIHGRVRRSFNILPNFQELSCVLKIRLLPDGNVASVAIQKSSGNEIFDRHAENAVRKAAPLPVPESVRLFRKMRSISFVFDPMF